MSVDSRLSLILVETANGKLTFLASGIIVHSCFPSTVSDKAIEK